MVNGRLPKRGKESPQTNLDKEFQTKNYPQLAVTLILKYFGEGGGGWGVGKDR